ncbi:MAG: hypothetical protein ACREQI_15090 [Candidatus Binataceae bacterium]
MNAAMCGIVAALIVSLTAGACAMAAGPQSERLNDYLHSNRLPFINAEVYANQSGRAASVTLTGELAGRFHFRFVRRRERTTLKTDSGAY